ncbi:MAG TPA: endolytic transglycosylase MltG [Ktedonobacteraceae bacterium]|jgi:UPF0755 protein|nr:endolytic transglycosylase MltG [Ktedonobacteraceae bacterium]
MRKRGRGTLIAVILVTVILFAAIYEAWSTVTTIFAPPATNQTKQVTLVIEPNETTEQIANDLYQKGLIRNPLAFRIWARIKGLDTRLQTGVYLIKPGMSVDQIIAQLLEQQPEEQRLLVVDGYRIEQIANAAAQLGLVNFNKQSFLNYTHHPAQFPDAAKYPILKGLSSMEGLLYPDTYLIPLNYNTTQIIDMMLNEFTQAVQANNLVALAQRHGLTEYQMIILASIVQREASNDGQMPLISGIYWNRIYQPSADVGGPYLKSDPTVEYARETDNPPANGDYWQDLNNFGTGDTVDPNSPWNTYTHSGWPPTPISSPGLAALKAAASPASTSCYYFFSKKDGSLVCAATYAQMLQEEH